VINALTVDVEDYYQVGVFQKRLDRSEWSSFESRVERNTEQLLEWFDVHGARATFFCLGGIADRHPALIRRIAAGGHEVASHGYDHDPVHKMTPESFCEDARRTREVLESLSGSQVLGYRAPSFSITTRTLWALDALLDAGYAYDSSIFPIRRPDYGIPGAARAPHAARTPAGRSIAEFPLTVATFLGRAVPVSGGGYFRMFPFAVTKWGFAKANREGRPAVFYLHPWEIDASQPDLRHKTGAIGSFRHYVGLKGAADKLEKLLKAFPFRPMREILAERGLLPSAAAIPSPA
jgi:polysaccharide deacetylase family protein (PEP-CTERM system associated)